MIAMNGFLDCLSFVLTNLPSLRKLSEHKLPNSYHELDAHFTNIASRANVKSPVGYSHAPRESVYGGGRESVAYGGRESVQTMRNSTASRSWEKESSEVLAAVRMRMQWEPGAMRNHNGLYSLVRKISQKGTSGKGTTRWHECVLKIDKETRSVEFSQFNEPSRQKKGSISEFDKIATRTDRLKSTVTVSLRYAFLKKISGDISGVLNPKNVLQVGLANGADLTLEMRNKGEYEFCKREICNALIY